MTPDLSFAAVRRRSAGIGIVTAIFLLVVLSGLGGRPGRPVGIAKPGHRARRAGRARLPGGAQRHRMGPVPAQAKGRLQRQQQLRPACHERAGRLRGDRSCTSVDGPAVIDPLTGNAVKLRVLHMRAEACSAALPITCASAVRGPDFVQRVIEVQL